MKEKATADFSGRTEAVIKACGQTVKGTVKARTSQQMETTSLVSGRMITNATASNSIHGEHMRANGQIKPGADTELKSFTTQKAW